LLTRNDSGSRMRCLAQIEYTRTPTMESVASQLKSEREKRKISLSQIAADTHISLRYLESLEEGRYDDLPGGMYNRAFLRAYCERLDIDQREMIRRYEEEILPLGEKLPKSKVHIPPQSSPIRLNPIIIWGIMLLISATAIFINRKWIGAVFSPYFSHASAPDARYEPPKRQAISPPPPAVQANPPPSDSVQPLSAPNVTSEASLPTPSAPLNNDEAPTAQVRGGESVSSSLPAIEQPLQLEIVGTGKCWISILSDGVSALKKEIVPGEVQSFHASEKFFIVVGNAGGIHLKINGKSLKPLGQSGEVRRILIDKKTLPDLLDPNTG
jgi:cytoskeleton protein RodZ